MDFPRLFDDAEIERRLSPPPQERTPGYQLFAMVRATYPGIAERLKALWGTPAFEAYVDELVITERNDRAGFPFPVLQSILALGRLHRNTGGEVQYGIEAWVSAPHTRDRPIR